MEARTRHTIFESYPHTERWKDWWLKQWQANVEFYFSKGWAMIPIAVRGKHPLKAQYNYESRGANGPYLSVPQALEWVSKDFNLAVVAGPSRMIWADLDDPALFKKAWLKGLVMRTPRGYGIPLKPDSSINDTRIEMLKARGYDFRTDILYELVPNSETCMFDHHLQGESHNLSVCVNSKHDYRIREWVDRSKPVLSFTQFWNVLA